MVETGRAFYPPGEKVRGLVSDADLLQYSFHRITNAPLYFEIETCL